MSDNTTPDILIAGAVAAFSVDLLVYPLDTLKTRIQSPDYARLFVHSATGQPSPALFRGLYQGVGSVIIATLPSSGAFFTTYERTKSLLHALNPPTSSHPTGLVPTPFIHATASSLAELVSCAILTPAEVIKQNAQMVSSSSSSSSSSAATDKHLKTNATLQTLARFRRQPTALWRGYTALAGRNLPYTALHFPLFEHVRGTLRAWRERRGVHRGTVWESGWVTGVSAGAAGTVAAIVTTPIDVVKTRIMLSAGEEGGREASFSSSSATGKQKGGQAGGGAGAGLVDAFGKSVSDSKETAKSAVRDLNAQRSAAQKGKKSAWVIGKEVVSEKGFVGLWRGGLLRGVWTFLGSGLYLGVYESGRLYLAERRRSGVEEEDTD